MYKVAKIHTLQQINRTTNQLQHPTLKPYNRIRMKDKNKFELSARNRKRKRLCFIAKGNIAKSSVHLFNEKKDNKQ